MSKEQECFNRIKLFINHMADDFDSEEVKVVDKALKEYVSIKEADPSKAMEALEEIDSMFYLDKYRTTENGNKEEYEFYPGYTDEYNIIKQYILKAQEQEKLLKSGDLSDGYHTFNQLYYQRCVLFASLVRLNKDKSWKSFKHSDGKYCFDSNGEWFIVDIDTPIGSYTYHYEKKYWDLFECQELECGKEWDGHTEEDISRLLSLPNEQEKELEEYKALKKKLGCPFEVYAKLTYDTPIVDKNGYVGYFEKVRMLNDEYWIEAIFYSNEEGAKNCIRGFKLSDYQKTWWLKADR